MPNRETVHTGGCQCGAVRYALYAQPTHGSICHCRMCQKASGNYFAAFARVPLDEFAWTRGEPAVFKSSELVERGFCRDCGTPLFFRYVDLPRLSVAVGSLDDPSTFKPDQELWMARAHPWHSVLAGTTKFDGRPSGVREKFAAYFANRKNSQ